MTTKTLNNLLGDKERTEITRWQGQYYVLHICRNNVPVPLFYDKSAIEIKKYIEMHEL